MNLVIYCYQEFSTSMLDQDKRLTSLENEVTIYLAKAEFS